MSAHARHGPGAGGDGLPGVLPPGEVHLRLHRIAEERSRGSPSWRERLLAELRRPERRRSLRPVALALLPLVVAIVLLLLGVSADGAVAW